MQPLPELVAGLNDYQPAFLASYPTMLSLLAEEAAANRLQIEPALPWSGGEYLSPAAQLQIERAFDCPLINEYGASECLSIAYGCDRGWLHVNADWTLLEPSMRNTALSRQANLRRACSSPISPTGCSRSFAMTWPTAS